MKKVNLFCLLILGVLLLGSGCQKDLVINTTTDFSEYLKSEMDVQHIPAVSALIFKQNTILHEEYLGKSQVSLNLALESDHAFLLASVSKTITATALLQLYEEGLFSLDDGINAYLPFTVLVPDYSTAITFRMLLTHTSGIADGSAIDDQYYYGEDSPVSLDYFLENYLTAGGEFYSESENFHDFTPGSQHEYSNEGSALIAVLVEQISGQAFNEYCKENIFIPLGMTHTSWRLDEVTGILVQPYNWVSGGYDEIAHYTFTDYPNGGLRSTATDMFYFLRAFVQGGISNDYQLLKSETIDEMLTLQIPDLSEEMGLHMFFLNPTLSLWGHDGGEQGVATIMAFNRDTKVGAIILANQGEAELEEMLAEAYKLGTIL